MKTYMKLSAIVVHTLIIFGILYRLIKILHFYLAMRPLQSCWRSGQPT